MPRNGEDDREPFQRGWLEFAAGWTNLAREQEEKAKPAESEMPAGESFSEGSMGSGTLENLSGESGSGEPQLGPKVLGLNAEGVLKILGAQKLLAEVSVGGSLPLDVCLEGAYFAPRWRLERPAWSSRPYQCSFAWRLRPFRDFHASWLGRLRTVFFGFGHGTLLASVAVYLSSLADTQLTNGAPCGGYSRS